MRKFDCDTCLHGNEIWASECNSCCTGDEIPTNYIPINETAYEDDHIEILNALATLIEICNKYQEIKDGCSTMCPLRSRYNDEDSGWESCSLEPGMYPADWTLLEPNEEEDFPILLDTDYIELEEENYEDPPRTN